MSGRYGMDQLYKALMAVCLALIVINMFVKTLAVPIAMWVVLGWAIFRAYSRNLEKRKRENDAFMKFWKPVKSKVSITFRRIREVRTHRFRTCPKCKAVIRLPRKKGTRTITCPRCHTDFETHIKF